VAVTATLPPFSPRALAALTAVYGSRVPKDPTSALGALETSPAAPTDKALLAEVRQAALCLAGEEIDALGVRTKELFAAPRPVGSARRPMPQNVALLLASKSDVAAGLIPGMTTGTAPVLSRYVSEQRARELFSLLAKAPDIPHRFVDEGCHFRAHVEARRLEELGVYSEKAFLVPDGADLRIKSPHSPIGFTLAIFHTAPVIFVRTDEGKLERRIIDPSLFDEPVSVEKWAALMDGLNKKPVKTMFLPRFAFHLSDRDAPPATWRPGDLEDSSKWNADYKLVEEDMKSGGFYDHMKELAENASGQREQEVTDG
jgi:hypothetical protein